MHTIFVILMMKTNGPISLKVVPHSFALILYICFMGHVCSIDLPNFIRSCICLCVADVLSHPKLLFEFIEIEIIFRHWWTFKALIPPLYLGGDEELRVERWRGLGAG